MKKFVKITLIIVAISGLVLWNIVAYWYILDPTFSGSNSQDWPSECGSGFEIIYSDSTKHNSTKIREAIANKAPEMNENSHGANGDWWNYVSVGEPDEAGVASIMVPGIFMSHSDNLNYDLLIGGLMELEGLSEIKPGRTWCYSSL
jgi:hypothetical protein